MALRPNAGHGLLIFEVYRSHTTHHSRWDSAGRVISSSQRPLLDNTQIYDIHAPGGLRTHNLSSPAAADLRLRALAYTPAYCRSRIRLRSWSFSHVPALPLPVVGLILDAAQEKCLCIEIGSTTPCRFHID